MKTLRLLRGRRLGAAVATAAALCAGTSQLAGAASPGVLCVGVTPGCFATIQAALAAAGDGDTIAVSAGTYTGPITIAKSIDLVGAGAALTVIRGGGPVVTVGDLTGATSPTVSISRVTVTGGLLTGTVVSGAGVSVAGPDSGNATAATLSISDSVITGNRVAVMTVAPGGAAPCGPPRGKQCSFASGGGIDNAGHLTLTNTRISDNVAENVAANEPLVFGHAGGAGIFNHPHATLSMSNCVVSGNRVVATSPVAENVAGGGIADDGVLTIANSEVTGNSVDLSTALRGSIFDGTNALSEGGGIAISERGVVTIANSTISGNTNIASNTGGDVNADTGGIDSDGTVTISNSKVENNRAQSSVPPTSGFAAVALGGGLEVEIGATTLNNTSVDGNSLLADSRFGIATVLGAGLMNEDGGRLTLHNSDVFANVGTAVGGFGFAEGGGIDNTLGPGHLTLVNSALTGNSMAGSPGIEVLGGGLYSADVFDPTATLPATLNHTVIADNSPDQCVGC